jgi:ferredoxin
MQVWVDKQKCSIAGICVKECPEVFRFEPGSKKATVIIDRVPLQLQEKVRLMSVKCPEGAIIIEENNE